jgi:hypothetical protein
MKRICLGMSATALLVVSFLSLNLFRSEAISSKLKDVQFKGYITEVHSPTSFLVDDYKITVEDVKDIDLENIDEKAVKFDPAEKIKVGTFIKVKGKYDPDTLEAIITEVKIDMKQFRNLSATVVLDDPPTAIQKSANGKWTGTIVADARRIVINEQTDLRFKLNKSEEKAEKEKEKQAKKAGKDDDAADDSKGANAEPEADDIDPDRDEFGKDDDLKDLLKDSRPLQELDQVQPGVYMTYHGTENASGVIVAETVVFVRNEKTKQEKDMWKKLRLKEKEAKNEKSFGELKVGNEKYKLLPDKEIQDYITRLGERLVPAYQRGLADDDQNKIPFHFAVVYSKSVNAGCYATGTMVIDHELLAQLENEAQLAFVMSHEIAHATQEHTVRELNHNHKRRTGLLIASAFAAGMGYYSVSDLLKYSVIAMEKGYARTEENQADRMGLANMIANGYDPREAPRTWKVMSLLGLDSPKAFWAEHDTNTERRSFLWLTIHNTYAGLDFSNLKRDSDDFHRIAEIIRTKYPSKLKRKA